MHVFYYQYSPSTVTVLETKTTILNRNNRLLYKLLSYVCLFVCMSTIHVILHKTFFVTHLLDGAFIYIKQNRNPKTLTTKSK